LGRVRDFASGAQMLTGLRRIASLHDGDFRITPNQNLVIANVAEPKRAEIERIASDHGLLAPRLGLRRNSMACVALPTCGLALAESERYLPDLVLALEERLATHGIEEDDIVIRMTGCPNGCARPYLAEIGLVGTGPGRYNLYLGGRKREKYREPHLGDLARLQQRYRQSVDGPGQKRGRRRGL
jgi:sulfite reductase (NADPH) hemoprotein beta-component